jgi:regulatory factor X 1/2/3
MQQQLLLQTLNQHQQPQAMLNLQDDESDNKFVNQQFTTHEVDTMPADEEVQKSVNPFPDFGHILTENSNAQLPNECTTQDVFKFEEIYTFHCQKIFDQVCDLKSNAIENIWRAFWRTNASTDASSHYEERLSMTKFVNLCSMDCVVEWVKQADFLFYQFCVEILIPDVTGVLPTPLVSSIRNLGKSVEGWMREALVNMPERMRLTKMNVISTFSMTLRRYTSLNHLAQTVKNSMHNTGVMLSMLSDLNKVDFNYIKVKIQTT